MGENFQIKQGSLGFSIFFDTKIFNGIFIFWRLDLIGGSWKFLEPRADHELAIILEGHLLK